jgi:cell division protein FtsB
MIFKAKIEWHLSSWVALGVLALVFLWGILGRNGLADLIKLRAKRTQWESRNSAVEAQNSALLHQIERLKNDWDFIESIARKELEMVRENEVVIQISPQTDISAPANTSK